MIPKKIHYCWFGRGEMPKLVKKCIASWNKYCPDYEIIEWNEENFDVNSFDYCAEAYAEGKYAFVSDVARAKALYDYGGIYLDTDVTVLKTFDGILDNSVVLGFEEGNYIATSFMAAEPNHKLFKEFVSHYTNKHFKNCDGTYNAGTNVLQLTKMLTDRGLVRNNQYQTLSDSITIFPKDFFSPYDYINCVYETTDNSICVHHFFVSWMSWKSRAKKRIKKVLVKVIGKNMMVKIRRRLYNMQQKGHEQSDNDFHTDI